MRINIKYEEHVQDGSSYASILSSTEDSVMEESYGYSVHTGTPLILKYTHSVLSSGYFVLEYWDSRRPNHSPHLGLAVTVRDPDHQVRNTGTRSKTLTTGDMQTAEEPPTSQREGITM